MKIGILSVVSLIFVGPLGFVARAEPVKGTILGPDEKPVVGAQVVIMDYEGRDTHSVSDKDGRFSLDLNPYPKSQFAGRGVFFSDQAAIGGGTLKVGDNTFRLAAARSVEGVVVDDKGKPVANARVEIETLMGEELSDYKTFISIAWAGKTSATLQPFYSAQSDADGRFQVKNVPQRGHVRLRLNDARFVSASATAQIASKMDPIKLVAQPGANIQGRVLGLDGKPVAGVEVSAQGVQHQEGWASATTDAQGRYLLSSLPSGLFNVLITTDNLTKTPEQAPIARAAENVMAKTGKTVTLDDIKLSPGVLITGRVLDENGAPIPNVMIGVHGPHRPRSGAAVTNTKSDEKGFYQLRVLPGDNFVYIMGPPPGYYAPREDSAFGGRTVKVSETGLKDFDFSLRKALKLAGVVVDENGNALPDVKVVTSQDYEQVGDTSNAKGEWEIEGLQPGKFQIGVEGAWQIVGANEARLPADKPLKLVLRKAAPLELSARVVTPNGEAVSDASVNLTLYVPTGADSSTSMQATARTGIDGRFSWTGARRDARLSGVRVSKAGYLFVSGGKITQEGEKWAVSDVVLAPLAGKRSGRVLTESGKPVSGATIYVASIDQTVVSDAKGHFEIGPLPVGDIKLLAVAPQGAAQIKTSHVGKNDAALELKLQPFPTLESRDVERAFAILKDVFEKSKGTDYHGRSRLAATIAPHDAARAQELQVENTDPMNALHIISTQAKVEAAQVPELRQQVEKISSPGMRAYATAFLGIKIVDVEPEAAKELLQQGRALLKAQGFNATPGNESELVYTYGFMAALAERLKQPVGEMLSDMASVVAERYFKNDPENTNTWGQLDDVKRAMVGALAMGSARLAERTASELSDSHRVWALSETVVELAKYDPGEALRVLEIIPTITPKNESRTMNGRPDYAFGVAAQAIVPVLAKRDPAAALALARRVTSESHRGKVLALAAQAQAMPLAGDVFREAMLAAQSVGMMSASPVDVASLALRKDEKLGRELLENMKEQVIALSRNEYSYDESQPPFWFYYARIAPHESRLYLEKAWAKRGKEEYDNTPAAIALAMSAVDVKRALAMAEELPPNRRFDVKHKIACYLLMTSEARRFARWKNSPMTGLGIEE